LQALETLPLRYADPCPRVEIPIKADVTDEAFWQIARGSAKGVVAFHPGSGSQQKLWPLDGWGEVMSWAGRHGLGGIVIQGPAERDRGLRTLLRERGIPDWPWSGDLSLHELASLLERCQVVVSHDSGIAHLAAAVGVITLALFGPTDPHVWGPRSPRACVLQPAAAQPLTLHNLPPEVVIQTLHALLEGSFAWQPASVPCTIRRLENN
jgi:heptosyltransferase III